MSTVTSAGLAIHLTHPTAPKPDEAALAASRDGKAFIVGSSEGWGRAALAAGTDPDAALAAARRTAAFYTGESAESGCSSRESLAVPDQQHAERLLG